MTSTIKIRAKISGDITEVKSLVRHPMETGTRRNEAGERVPIKHITQLTFSNNDKPVMVANFSTAVSRDPYFSFRFAGGTAGDTLKAAWVDNTGASDETETTLE